MRFRQLILVAVFMSLMGLVTPCQSQTAAPPEGGHWPPQGALHQNADLVRMGPEVAVRADCGGVPVYGFGFSYIYGLSPDLASAAVLQQGNESPTKKIVPKKSWQIKSNRIGATPPRMPRTARSDIQPLLGVHLIDGDPETHWCSRGQNRSTVEPAWLRIDLARETEIHSIEIVPRDDNLGMPKHLTVRLSRDGWNWDTVYDNQNHPHPADAQPQTIEFAPTRAKQIWIVGHDLRICYMTSHIFSVAEVRVLDKEGENVALLSQGAAVTVSSFESYIASQRETHQTLWPTHYDLGVEWIRINYAGSVLNWRVVEREKGVYEIDPIADAAITQAVKNGCKINFGLGFTNWLYTAQNRPPRKDEKQRFLANEVASLSFPRSEEPEMLEGFKNYVRFMVQHFKDRVDYYEIWNEQSNGYGGWYDAGPEHFAHWVKEVSPIIKEIDPQAKVVFGSLSGLGPRREVGIDWLKTCFEEGIAPHIDMICWHGYYGAAPGTPEWESYVADIQETKQLAESYSYEGEYSHSEWCIFSPYPQNSTEGLPWISEIVKAKHMARFAVTTLGQDVLFYWNETWADGHIDRDVGLFRNGFSASPVSPTQPQPSYYVLRTLCTVFDEARAAPLDVEFSNTEQKLEVSTFELPTGERLLSVSLAGTSVDESPLVQSDICISGLQVEKAIGIDVLNGTEQKLVLNTQDGVRVLKNIMIKDYPQVICLSPQK